MPDSDKNPAWSFGNLVYYGRADLKQSDHRPVVGILGENFVNFIEYSILIDLFRRY